MANNAEFTVQVYCNEQDFDQVKGIVDEEIQAACKQVEARLRKEEIKNTHISVEDTGDEGEVED